jgi:hypothetical protein
MRRLSSQLRNAEDISALRARVQDTDGTTTANDLVKTTLFERSYGRIAHLVPVENIGTGDLCCVRQIPGTL